MLSINRSHTSRHGLVNLNTLYFLCCQEREERAEITIEDVDEESKQIEDSLDEVMIAVMQMFKDLQCDSHSSADVAGTFKITYK